MDKKIIAILRKLMLLNWLYAHFHFFSVKDRYGGPAMNVDSEESSSESEDEDAEVRPEKNVYF